LQQEAFHGAALWGYYDVVAICLSVHLPICVANNCKKRVKIQKKPFFFGHPFFSSVYLSICYLTNKITALVSLLSPQKFNNNIFKLEVSFVLPSLVTPLSWWVDGIVGQTNIQSGPPFHVDHGNAIY
jgi:hypothetical protein